MEQKNQRPKGQSGDQGLPPKNMTIAEKLVKVMENAGVEAVPFEEDEEQRKEREKVELNERIKQREIEDAQHEADLKKRQAKMTGKLSPNGQNSSNSSISSDSSDDYLVFEKELFFTGMCKCYESMDIPMSPASSGKLGRATDHLFNKLPEQAKNVMVLTAFSKFGPIALEIGCFYLDEWLDKLLNREGSSIEAAIRILKRVQEDNIGKPTLD